jgi:hypothetical protein
VTNRMMAILHNIGLGGRGTSNTKVPPYGLVCLIAAAVHDYGHPHVNNAFLIHQVSSAAEIVC